MSDTSGEQQREKTFSPFKGLLLAFLSAMLASIKGAVVKFNQNLTPIQLCLSNVLGLLVISLPLAIRCQQNIFGSKEERIYLISRGMSGAIGLFFGYIMYQNLSLAEISVFNCSVPVSVTVAARIFLMEPFGVLQSISVLLTVLGILFAAQVPNRLSEHNLTYTAEGIRVLLASVLVVAIDTFLYVILRRMKNIHPAIVMFNVAWIGVLCFSSLAVFTGEFPWPLSGFQQISVFVMVLTNYGILQTKTVALQCEHAGPVSIVKYASSVMISFLLQILLFLHKPNALDIIGGVLVLTSVTLIGLTKF